MIQMIEALGSRILSRFVPSINAAAYNCLCEAGWCWGIPGGKCCCSADCRTKSCYSGSK
jgi:hypothetical protein